MGIPYCIACKRHDESKNTYRIHSGYAGYNVLLPILLPVMSHVGDYKPGKYEEHCDGVTRMACDNPRQTRNDKTMGMSQKHRYGRYDPQQVDIH